MPTARFELFRIGSRWTPALGASKAALPIEDTPADRVKIEQRRGEAIKAAEASWVINLDDLT